MLMVNEPEPIDKNLIYGSIEEPLFASGGNVSWINLDS